MNWKERATAVGHYLLARLQEPSTWRGLVIIISAGGWAALDSSNRGEVIMQAGLILAGLIQAAVPQATLYRK